MKLPSLTLLIVTIVFSSMVLLCTAENEKESQSMSIDGNDSDVKLPNTPAISKIEYPELPEKVPHVKNLIDFSNQVIELFNYGRLNDKNVSELTNKEWKENIIEKSGMYDKKALDHEIKYSTPVVADYHYNAETEKQKLRSILVYSVRLFNGKKGWLILGIYLKNNKIDTIISDFFGDANDTYVVMKFFDEETKFLNLTFDHDKPMPWVKWDKEGKIQEQGTKTRLQIEQESKLPFERIIYSARNDELLRIIDSL